MKFLEELHDIKIVKSSRFSFPNGDVNNFVRHWGRFVLDTVAMPHSTLTKVQ